VHVIKAYAGVEVNLHSFLTSKIDVENGQIHAPVPPKRRLCGLQGRPGLFGEEKNIFPCRKSIHDFSDVNSLGLVTITNMLPRPDHLILM
jgi:hypothetical protein